MQSTALRLGNSLRLVLPLRAAARIRPMSAITVEATHADVGGGDAGGVRKLALDFNEVRLVGRVTKVLDLGTRSAQFVLSTQRVFRRTPRQQQQQQPDGEQAGAAAAEDDGGLRRERQSHLVVGHGSAEDGDWQQHLYPGSHVELTGQLAYRLIRRRAAAPSDAAAAEEGGEGGAAEAADGGGVAARQLAKFEPIIRMSKIAPAGPGGGGGGHDGAGPDRRRGGESRYQRQRRHRDADVPGSSAEANEWGPRGGGGDS